MHLHTSVLYSCTKSFWSSKDRLESSTFSLAKSLDTRNLFLRQTEAVLKLVQVTLKGTDLHKMGAYGVSVQQRAIEGHVQWCTDEASSAHFTFEQLQC